MKTVYVKKDKHSILLTNSSVSETATSTIKTSIQAPAAAQTQPATIATVHTKNQSGGGGVTQPHGNTGQPPSGGGGNGGNRLHQQTTGTLSKFTGMLLVTFFINRYLLFL